MNCVLIYRDLSEKEIRQIKELHLNGADIFISPVITVPQDLEGLDIENIDLDEEIKNQIANSVKNELLQYGNTMIDGNPVKDWLSVQNTSIWYYHKQRMYLALRNYMYTLHEVKQYSETHKQVHVFSHNTFSSAIPQNTIQYHKKRKGGRIPFQFKIIFGLSIIIKTLNGVVQRIFHGNRSHVIITNPNALGKYLNIKTLDEDIEDLFLGYLRQKTDQSFIHFEDFIIPKLGGFKPKVLHKSTHSYPTLYAEYILFFRLFHPGIIIQLYKFHLKLKSVYNILLSNTGSETKLQLTRMLKNYHWTSLFYTYKLLAFTSFFNGKKYRTITAKDENSPSTKTILDAAKYCDIKTIGIQHGTISKLNINFMFTKEDQKAHPMPDATLVWGEISRNILIQEGAYPKESVRAVGQIRTDIIPILNQNKLSIKIPEQKKYDHTVLFASQPQPDPLLRKRAAEDVFNAVGKLKSTLLLIKLHPKENDPNYYHNIAKNIGCTNYVIEDGMDLYKAIALCDTLVTCYSTVGGEAVYFDKPLVILDHLKLDFCGYLQEGVATRATNSDELHDILLNISMNNFSVDKVHYAQYKEKYAFQIDGNVSTRCLNYITNMQ